MADDRLPRPDAEAVIRRAAELDTDPVVDGRLDRAALTAAADEVGISPAAVHRALAEYDAGVLTREPPKPSVIGPALVVAARTLDLPPDMASAAVERWLTQQTYVLRRRQGPTTRWERRKDLIAGIRRKVDVTKRIQLADPDHVTASVLEVDGGRSLVRLEADLTTLRTGLGLGLVGAPALLAPATGTFLAVITGEVLFAAGAVPLGAALAGAGLVGSRRTLRSTLTGTEQVLEGFLDRLESGL